MNNSIPNISASANATSFSAMQAQMKKMIAESASASAKELGLLIQAATKVNKTNIKQSPGIVPEFNDRYVQCVVLAAAFRALRDEYSTAYMRVESVQQDKALCQERVAGASDEHPLGNCRTDVEFASVTRSLEYYDTLDQRLEEIDSGLKATVAAYEFQCLEQRKADEDRQQGVEASEIKYSSMPQLRWIKADDRQADPKGCELADDTKTALRQAERFIEWNWNRS